MHQLPRHDLTDQILSEASQRSNRRRKEDLGQFMTPVAIAGFMAGLFSAPKGPVKLLDAGAGVGSLTSAFLERQLGVPTEVVAWEIDPLLRHDLEGVLKSSRSRSNGLRAVIHGSDFLEDAVFTLTMGSHPSFTHAILNPPYKKINARSPHRFLLRKVGVETVNLYSAFVALSVLLLGSGGELVAIIPRSFCNGPYYRPFRELLFSHCAIRHIHLFESRSKAFQHDHVLQENIIVHLAKSEKQTEVTVSTSYDASFQDYTECRFRFSEIVRPDDPERFLRIPASQYLREADLPFGCSLHDIGLEVCTGPVVDFRVRTYWRERPCTGTVPLLYPHHFAGGALVYPREKKKPNALVLNSSTQKWLLPRGFYVLVKRFSSKEERRRVVAYVLDPGELLYPYYGFENHWNVFHLGKRGMDDLIAYGLATYLNSTLLDKHFRIFSGHTQVNATDLRTIKYPDRDTLRSVGARVKGLRLSQQEIDSQIRRTH